LGIGPHSSFFSLYSNFLSFYKIWLKSVSKCMSVLLLRMLSYLWSPYGIGRPLYFCPVVSIFSFFFFPRLISAAADWMSTVLRHMVWCGPSANLECRSENASGSLEIQDAKMMQKSPSDDHRTTSSCYIFATKARIDNRKKTR